MRLPELPVSASFDELRRALGAGHAVLSAPPGSGKTTLVPLALLDELWLGEQKILMLEPRRPAARLAAQRLAQIAGCQVGELVGYQVRLERRIGPQTRVEVLTEGVLTRRLQQDPTLEGVGLLIFDEFHERNLQADLALALSLDVQRELREELRLLLMSATLDSAALSTWLGATQVIAQGRQYPVAEEYLSPHDKREPLQAIPSLVRHAMATHTGDILVFLPGRREIDLMATQLRDECAAAQVGLQCLFGALSSAEQDRILRPASSGRRVILSTDLAESSLTIEGVTTVVDSGLARKPQFDPGSGMTRLQLQPISQASAIQRAGRAGRLQAGHCYRAWTQARQSRRLVQTPPEILQADLAPLVLELAQWGVRDPQQLRWLDPPPAAHWQQAADLLRSLGALQPDGSLSALGRPMSALGVEPRLARILVGAQGPSETFQACAIAALLAEPGGVAPGAGTDLSDRVQRLADSLRVAQPARGAAHKLAVQLMRRLPPSATQAAAPVDSRSAAQLLSLGFPDRIALARGKLGSFLLSNGRGAVLDPAEALATQPLLVVAQLNAGQREGRIWSALAIGFGELRAVQGGNIQQMDEVVWDNQRDAVVARRVERFGALLLAEQPLGKADDEAAQSLLLEQLAQRWPQGLLWSPAAEQLRARLQRLADLDDSKRWPAVSDQALCEQLESWLGPYLQGLRRWSDLAAIDLYEALLGQLDWPLRQQLDAWLPSHFVTPALTRRAIDYSSDGDPQVAVPLQEMFGQAETPRLAEGRQALVLSLLNPAGRPLALTADLASFWHNAYPQVRKELRGRYPKHAWPENPLDTPARRGTGRPRRV